MVDMEKIKKAIFIIFDLYAQPIPIFFNKDKKYRTYIGLILGIISIIFWFILIVIYSVDLFGRKSFKIISGYHFNENSTVQLSNNPFMISLLNDNGILIKDKKLINLTLGYFDSKNGIYKNIEIEECNNLENEIHQNLKNNFYCPKLNELNLELKGVAGRNDRKYLELFISKCVGEDCYDENTINQKLKNSFFILYFIEENIDQYSYHNPIKKNYRIEYFPIYLEFSKIYTFFFSQTIFKSNDGIFTNNIKTYEFSQYEEQKVDFMPNGNYLIVINFNSKEKINKIERTFLNFSDIISNIVAYFNLVHFLGYYLTMYLTRSKIMEDIGNKIILKSEFKKKMNILIKKKMSIENKNIEGNNLSNKNSTAEEIKVNDDMTNSKLKQELNKNNNFDKINNKNIQNYEKIKLSWYHYLIPVELFPKKGKVKKFLELRNNIYSKMTVDNIYLLNENISDEDIIYEKKGVICHAEENILKDVKSKI